MYHKMIGAIEWILCWVVNDS